MENDTHKLLVRFEKRLCFYELLGLPKVKICLKEYVSRKSDSVEASIAAVSERHLLQIVFGPYIVEEEGNISSTV
ncbi:uncharacterized protein Gasu_61740 [Galdieria sulphuraria]|uniref:Uncharacterized protein n=1 Tax=Galdieria sulphuraria TaxID=130081 RepID=M2X8L3_GALSU|nr:uncharacterized protein Gasu_61740 [Galdieria sulphuraria]EME26182.1 hypothetical protein Gasu_61740 [Galdieria sulphuraria]|eukprot:XP_005702702.1 hypothetical protein Gasu_61740 [Galdieria sulphuraria]